MLAAVLFLALHQGKGAPRTAVYKFVRCNPEGDQANCVTHQSPEMEWSPDLPSKLPASTAMYLEAEPEEGESPLGEEIEVEEDKEEEEPMMSQEGESPEPDYGSGGYEGSGFQDTFMADRAFMTAKSETGSGESWKVDAEQYTGEDMTTMRRLFPSRSLVDEAKPEDQEMKEDHLLQL